MDKLTPSESKPVARIRREEKEVRRSPEKKVGKEDFLEKIISDPIFEQLMAAENLDEHEMCKRICAIFESDEP